MTKLNPENRALVATLLVLAGLVGIRLAQQALRDAPAFEVRVPPDVVQAISLTAHDRVVRIERSGEEWNLTLPTEAAAQADRASVVRFLSSWQDFETSYMVAKGDAAGASVGFDRNTTVRLEAEGGQELLALDIGDRLASGERIIRPVDAQTVYAGAISAADLLVADPAKWVDRAALSAAAERMEAFGLTNRHGRQVFERRDTRWTRAGLPLQDRAVTRLVLSALELGLAPQVDAGSVPPADDAAREPRISLWWEGQDGERHVAHLCGDVPGGERVYLDRETPALYSAPREELVRFGVAPADLDALPSP